MKTTDDDKLAGPLAELVAEDFAPHFGGLQERFKDDARWRQVRKAGSELWVDSGDIEAVGKVWTRQFSAVTTNNTLLNREVQKGQYDQLIKKTAALVRGRSGRRIDDRELALEIAFVLNARHGLRLVEAFDAFVSVEEHTDLAGDVDGSLRYARRLFAICPQRFLVKLPLTAAGLVAARRCREESIPVNLTLGFSARHNYLATRLARPAFVNVFLGRLNAFVADNGLGTGAFVGEKATMASQRVVRELRTERGLATRQIAASIRGGEQIELLIGVDVLTMPTAAAEAWRAAEKSRIADRSGEDYAVEFASPATAKDLRLDVLWGPPGPLVRACDELERIDPASLQPKDIIECLRDNNVRDLLIDWPASATRLARAEGKVPQLASWRNGLSDGRFGLDAVLNLAGLCSFAADQQAMDERVAKVLAR